MYILIYFLKGKLPWQDIKAKQKQERHEKISNIKSKVTVECLCEGLPKEFENLLRYAKELDFEECPKYIKFDINFQGVIDKLNKDDIPEGKFYYLWEKILSENLKAIEAEENKNKDKNKDTNEDNNNFISSGNNLISTEYNYALNNLKEMTEEIFKGYPMDFNDIKKYVKYIEEISIKNNDFSSANKIYF